MKQKLKKFKVLPILLIAITGLLTYKKINHNQEFLLHWLQFYAMALFIVIPVAIVLISLVEKTVERLLAEKHIVLQGIANVFPVLLVIGTLMTGISVYIIDKPESFSTMISVWNQELLKNSPMLLTLILIVGLIIKPLALKRAQKLNKSVTPQKLEL